MSRLLDHLKNAERKRRNLQERRLGAAELGAGPADKDGPAAPSGALGARESSAQTDAESRGLAEVRARAEFEAHHAANATIAQRRRADAAGRTQIAGERRQPGFALIRSRLGGLSGSIAFSVLAFVLGIGTGVLWLKSVTHDGAELSRAPAAVQPGTPAGRGTLALRIDPDHAGFAARAASEGRKVR